MIRWSTRDNKVPTWANQDTILIKRVRSVAMDIRLCNSIWRIRAGAWFNQDILLIASCQSIAFKSSPFGWVVSCHVAPNKRDLFMSRTLLLEIEMLIWYPIIKVDIDFAHFKTSSKACTQKITKLWRPIQHSTCLCRIKYLNNGRVHSIKLTLENWPKTLISPIYF